MAEIRTKPMRVWVAVEADGVPSPHFCGARRWGVVNDLEEWRPHWKLYGVRIRRATLTLDPVKPRKRRGRV